MVIIFVTYVDAWSIYPRIMTCESDKVAQAEYGYWLLASPIRRHELVDLVTCRPRARLTSASLMTHLNLIKKYKHKEIPNIAKKNLNNNLYFILNNFI
jgi:hypothetical protein